MIFLLLALFTLSHSSWSQSPKGEIRGTVQDSKGNPLANVTIRGKATGTMKISSADGSFVLTGAMIKSQDVATQGAIRAVFDRLIRGYATADGIALPVAFKVGSGRKPG